MYIYQIVLYTVMLRSRPAKRRIWVCISSTSYFWRKNIAGRITIEMKLSCTLCKTTSFPFKLYGVGLPRGFQLPMRDGHLTGPFEIIQYPEPRRFDTPIQHALLPSWSNFMGFYVKALVCTWLTCLWSVGQRRHPRSIASYGFIVPKCVRTHARGCTGGEKTCSRKVVPILCTFCLNFRLKTGTNFDWLLMSA